MSRVILFVSLWWIISSGSVQSWMIGLPALIAATWAGHHLSGAAHTRISVLGVVRFVPYFLWESLRGGVDVGLRTLSPRIRVRPDFYHYRTTLQTDSARTFFAYCASLLPGTLTADLQGEWLEIHTLTAASEPHEELVQLECFVAGVFTESETVQC